MLVLVLILVVIALVLLLAGWFLHLVVLAWTSVGISMLAGLVLIYDWWQTRAAVRAGRRAAGSRENDGDRDRSISAASVGAVGAGAAGVGAFGASGSGGFDGPDMEPATQVLPVVSPSGAQAERASAPSGAQAERADGSPSNASEDTIVMPVVAPSGEAAGPSGVSRSGGLSSHSVTNATVDDGADVPPVDDGTTAVDPGRPLRDGGPGAGTSGRDGGRESEPEAAGAARVPDGGATAVTGAAAAGVAGASAARGVDDATTTADARTAGADAGAGVDEPTSVAAAGQQTSDVDTRTRAVDQQPAQQQPAQQIDTSGEAPEEPRDPTLASLVARLPDEVIVIDEHPRYHVPECPALPGQPVIPLPVSEAVELGFTPCGWCAPNRALGERHPAEVR